MGKKIKVLEVCSIGFTVKTLILPLINALSEKYDVTIVCGKDEISEELSKSNYKFEYIDIGRKLHPIKNLKTIFDLYKYFKKEKYDIIHFHTPLAGILGRIAAKIARVPIILFTVRGFYFHENMSPIKKKVYTLLEKFGGWLSDFVFIQSAEDYKTALENGIVSSSKSIILGNGINLEKFDMCKILENDMLKLRQEFNISQDDIVIGIIGRVVREKGYVEWVKAAKEVLKKYNNVKFIAIGDTLDSERDKVKDELDQYIEDQNLKGKVIFAGIRYDIPQMISIMDIFTLPSYREGMPRSIIEAMSMNKPVIATNIRGCREEVVEGVTGFLVPVSDHFLLAEKIGYLIENPNLRESMGEEARKRAKQEFDEKIIISKQMGIIEKLLESKSKANSK